MTRSQKRRARQKGFTITLIAMVLMLGAYGILFSLTHFMLGTYIQGVDCSCLNVKRAKEYIEKELNAEEVIISFENGNVYETPLGEITTVVADENALKTILEGQKIKNMTKNSNHMGAVSFDTKAIEHYLRKIPEMQESNQQPEDAYLKWYSESHEFRIVQEQYGKIIDFDESCDFFIKKLEQGEYEINLSTVATVEPNIKGSMLEERLKAINTIVKGKQFSNLDTRIELDITKQNILMYIDGECILDTPCVTGNVADGCSTPTGIYYLYYKERNAVLRGSNSDGSRYASPVDYWMPFNGGIGFHDASWRNGIFGGEIYKTDGSHGCVNMPHDSAKTLYENITSDIPIIIYES